MYQLNNLFNINFKEIKEKIICIGKIDIYRISTKIYENIICLDKYNINGNDDKYVVEFEICNYEMERLDASIKIIDEIVPLTRIKNLNKSDEVLKHAIEQKIISDVRNKNNIEGIIIYDSDIEGIGNSESDLDIYVFTPNNYQTENYKIFGKTVDIEFINIDVFLSQEVKNNLKVLHRILVGKFVFGSLDINIIREEIMSKNIYEILYEDRISVAIGYFDDAKKFIQAQDIDSAKIQLFFSLFYIALAYLIKKEIYVIKEKWCVFLLKKIYFLDGDIVANNILEELSKVFKYDSIIELQKLSSFLVDINFELEVN